MSKETKKKKVLNKKKEGEQEDILNYSSIVLPYNFHL